MAKRVIGRILAGFHEQYAAQTDAIELFSAWASTDQTMVVIVRYNNGDLYGHVVELDQYPPAELEPPEQMGAWLAVQAAEPNGGLGRLDPDTGIYWLGPNQLTQEELPPKVLAYLKGNLRPEPPARTVDTRSTTNEGGKSVLVNSDWPLPTVTKPPRGKICEVRTPCSRGLM